MYREQQHSHRDGRIASPLAKSHHGPSEDILMGSNVSLQNGHVNDAFNADSRRNSDMINGDRRVSDGRLPSEATASSSNTTSSLSASEYATNQASGDQQTETGDGLKKKLQFGKSFLKQLACCGCSCAAACTPFARWRSKTNTDVNKHRVVVPNHLIPEGQPNPNTKYPGNEIRTTKYTILTFLPKNLFEQFHRFANLYFIFIVLLNWVPLIDAFGRELSMIPILFVLGVTAIKDMFEDRRRYNSDKKINHTVSWVYNCVEDRFVELEWKHIKVGDVVHLPCNSIVPADILLLHSSDPLGVCFLETSNLDGESNLKQRQVISSMADGKKHYQPKNFACTVECEQPNNQIYKFNGSLIHPTDQRKETVNKNHLLLRGCQLRNTDAVEGIVVYAGHETKAMLNNSGPRYKRSKLERLMNWDILWCVLILVILCLVGAIGCGVWLGHFDDTGQVPFVAFIDRSAALEAFIVFWVYIIILQVMIPISLYVTIEIVKLGQVFFITLDSNLYHEKSNKKIQCRALNIPEELGQIQYVMSDKTGTLTENQMIFRRCCVAGSDYGPKDINATDEQKGFPTASADSDETSADVKANAQLLMEVRDLSAGYSVTGDSMLKPGLSERDRRKACMLDFFMNMAVCNTVVVNAHPHEDKMNEEGMYDSASMFGGGSTPRGPSNVSSPLNPNKQPSNRSATPENLQLRVADNKNGGLTQMGPPSPTFYVPTDSKNNLLDNADNGSTLGGDSDAVTIRARGGGNDSIVFDNNSLANGSNSQQPMIHSKTVPSITTELVVDTNSSPRTDSTQLDSQSNPPTFRSMQSSSMTSGVPNGTLEYDAMSTGSAMTARPKSLNFPRNLLNLPKKLKLLPSLLEARSPSPSPSVITASPGYANPFYEAESPDELALVYASAAYGVKLSKRHINSVTVQYPEGSIEKLEVLHILPFDSVRKRMSVVIRHPRLKQIFMYSKGADSVMMELLSSQFETNSFGQNIVATCQEYINLYASYGLRTLCLAKREIPNDEYDAWAKEHNEAENAIEGREDLVFQSALRIERDLELLGVTGIEDRLQDGVSECIAALREATMKVWVLTGDKVETAVNIAYACKLFAYGMELIQLGAKTEDDADQVLKHHLDVLERELDSLSDPLAPPPPKRGLVVDGRTLAFCLHPGLEDMFIRLASQCTSVLICRATPLQKASVVKLVKEKLGALTLAIGDGANDVGMIQCADVGVGISGQEGMQAVMSSDYAIARFHYLQRLLLVHGHWCYQRLAKMILYFFYKNAMFVFVVFWFQLFNGWSAQVNIDPLYLMSYNLVFTSLPIIVLGVLDKDTDEELLLKRPELYRVGAENELYRTYSFWMNIADAFWQSLVIFFTAFFIMTETTTQLWELGHLVFVAICMCNHAHLLIEARNWNAILISVIVFSVIVLFGFTSIYNAATYTCCGPDPAYWVAQRMFSSASFWLALIFIIFLAILPRLTFRVISNTIAPSDILREQLIEHQNRPKRGCTGKGAGGLLARWSRSNRQVSIVPEETLGPAGILRSRASTSRSAGPPQEKVGDILPMVSTNDGSSHADVRV